MSDFEANDEAVLRALVREGLVTAGTRPEAIPEAWHAMLHSEQDSLEALKALLAHYRNRIAEDDAAQSQANAKAAQASNEQQELEPAPLRISRSQPGLDDWEHHLLIDLGASCLCLSSAVLGGGLQQARRYIINRSVAKDWRANDPESDMRVYARRLGLEPERCVGLITAVSMDAMQQAHKQQGPWQVQAIVTAGVGNAAAAGGQPATGVAPLGTINILVILEGQLSPAAMVGAVQTATEAKAAALRDARVLTRFAEIATGTTTDTVTIVNRASWPSSPYAGLATIPGQLIAQSVYQALRAAL